mmetsp:Transcript_9596/g.12550  ORF Transcript_9596/g.12550 Transcript_9596/m.12550 type:complete len:793 (+) Transcript_9596:464-2842(+)|eukprot:CAMPEP_0117742876 /NCGR_PEP_ID=MMETSP0947-20121206/5795_1 /TAXON_ID=44440 /ORGANISM="Chattonella subsalsa, Strain CCMP2191" /LENGTH=792 /DNA_ID=CAMNT_0005559459 /DNA_START=383 /DNA_END=2761 /DNA_ORIENTATION=-
MNKRRLILLSASLLSVQSKSVHKKLLECESSSTSYGLDSESSDTSVFSQGSKLRDFLVDYREGSDSFYEEKVEQFSIYSCEAAGTGETRYVTSSDASAAKTNSGDCIVTSEEPTASDCGLTSSDSSEYCCEVSETCYWEAPVEGQDRVRKYTDQEASDAETVWSDYVVDLSYFAIPGIILAALVFLGAPIYGIAQLCCKCCRLRPDGYSKAQQIIPFLFFLLFFIGAFVSGLLSFFGNQQVITGLNNMFSYTLLGIFDMRDFLFGAVSPLNAVVDSLGESAGGVNQTIIESDWIYDSVDTLSAMLTTWSDKYASVDGLDVTEELDAVSSSIDADLEPMVDSFIDLLEVLRDTLVDGKAGIEALVESAADTLSSLNSTLVGTADSIEVLQTNLNSYDNFRDYGSTSIFALSVAISGVTLIWMIAAKFLCKGSPCSFKAMNITWVLNWVLTMLSFIIAAVALTFAVVWSDTCEFIDIMAADFSPYLGNSVGGALNACFNDSNLVEAFNLSSTLDFGEQIESAGSDADAFDVASQFSTILEEFATVDETIDKSLNFTALYEEFSVLTSTSTGSCSFSEEYLTEEEIIYPWTANSGGFSGMGESFNQTNGESAVDYIDRLYNWPSDCSSLSESITALFAVAYYNSTLLKWQMRSDFGYDSATCEAIGCPTDEWPYDLSIYAYLEVFQSNLTSIQNELSAIVDDLTSDLISHVDDFLCNTNCGFLGDFYHAMYGSLCTTTLGGFGQISLSLYLLAVFNIPIIICTVLMIRRLRSPEYEDVKKVIPVESKESHAIQLT